MATGKVTEFISLKALSSARGALVLICANAHTGLIDVPEELILSTP